MSEQNNGANTQDNGANEQDSAPQTAGNGGQFVTRVWKLKGTGNEIPTRFDKAEVRIRLAAPASDATQAMLNMMALTGGNVQAVVDQFNGSAALDVQKAIKATFEGENAAQLTVADLQTQADQHTIAPNQRGGGTGGKRAVQAAKAAKLDAVQDAAQKAVDDVRQLAATNPEAARAQADLMVRLNLLSQEQAEAIFAEAEGGEG